MNPLQSLTNQVAALFHLPADKVGHFFAGCLLAAFGAAVALGLGAFGAIPTGDWRVAAFVAGLVGAGVKEVADWEDNQARPGEHGVEVADFLATVLPGLLCFVSLAIWR